MRHFLVFSLAACVIAASAVSVRADNQATAEIIASSLSDQFPDADITVRFQDGKVWLQGELVSKSEMQKAVKLVSSIDGVETVENEMIVSGGNGSELDALPSLIKEYPTTPKISNGKAAPMPMSVTTAGGVGYDNEVNQVAHGRGMRTFTPAPPQVQAVPRIQQAQPVKQAIPGTTHPATIETDSDATEIVNESMSGPIVYQGTNGVRQPALAMRDRSPLALRQQVTRGPRDYMSEEVAYTGGYPAAPANGAFVGGTQPNLPPYAWPSYAAHPNYAQVTYPKKYEGCTWPNIGPFYPYPQPPLGWRKVTMEWHDGNWFLDFDDGSSKGPFSPLFRQPHRYSY
ncbi:MAG: BON domain-containing protein [Thermoguttaceae bacterium]